MYFIILHYFLAFISTGKEKKKKNTAAGPKPTQGHSLPGLLAHGWLQP
jgi:hypothetical protein